MKPSISVELFNYRTFINEIIYINTLLEILDKSDKMKFTQLTETKRYLEERIADISTRIP